MIFRKTLILSLIILMSCLTLDAQNILLLEHNRKFKNHKFYRGDDIHLRVRTDTTDVHIRGEINAIYDSLLVVNYTNIVMLKDIEVVYRDRMWARIVSYSAIVAGGGYLVLDSFNRAINNEAPVVDDQTLVTSGIIIGAGLLLIPFKEYRHRVGKKWDLKILVW